MGLQARDGEVDVSCGTKPWTGEGTWNITSWERAWNLSSAGHVEDVEDGLARMVGEIGGNICAI